VFRARQLHEQWNAEEGAAALDRIGQRGSHGVILKARDVPLIAAAVDRLAEAGIPVVTLATDLPASRRAAHVGVDNRSAWATATLPDQPVDGDRPRHGRRDSQQRLLPRGGGTGNGFSGGHARHGSRAGCPVSARP
jgi:hypothetical protein